MKNFSDNKKFGKQLSHTFLGSCIVYATDYSSHPLTYENQKSNS